MNGSPGKVIVNLTITADGYSAGPNQSEQRPFGEDGGDGWGDRLHAWMFDDGEENRAEVDQIGGASAVIMGRNMFGPVRGPWDRDWNGWWGDDPPFHVPVFVLTHHARPPQPMAGGTTYHFVTDGIHAALEHAQAAAGSQDIRLLGGAETIRQYLQAGLVDEMHVVVSPILLGSGEHLLTGLDLPALGYRCTECVPSAKAAHYIVGRA